MTREIGPYRLGVAVVALIVVACQASTELSPRPLLAPLPSAQAAEMSSLSPEAFPIECAPGVTKYPAGIRPSRPLGWAQERPGFHILSDGHCVFDPTASPHPVSPQPIGP